MTHPLAPAGWIAGWSKAELDRQLEPLRRRLARQARRWRIPPDDLEDVVQDALLQLTRNAPEVQHPEAWLHHALELRCRDYWRQRWRRARREQSLGDFLEALLPPQPAPQEALSLRLDLRGLLGRLPLPYRRVLVGRFWAGCDHAEMAAFLSQTPPALRKALQRALARLRREAVAAGYLPASPGLSALPAPAAAAAPSSPRGVSVSDWHLDSTTLDRWLAESEDEALFHLLLHHLELCPACCETGGELLGLCRSGALAIPFGVTALALARSRTAAPALWTELRDLPFAGQRRRLADDPRFRSWGLTELLCRESKRAAPESARRAVELARLAVQLAHTLQDGEPCEAAFTGWIPFPEPGIPIYGLSLEP